MADRSRQNRILLIAVIALVLSLLVGSQIGLLLSRNIKPPGSEGRNPASLTAGYKEEYIVLVGRAYMLDHDLERAQAALAQLEAPNVQQWIANLLDRYIAGGQDPLDIRGLVELAHGLGVDSRQVVAYLATLTPPPTATPQPTPTPAPTDTPTATPPPATITPTPTAQPTDTPTPQATETPVPPTATEEPSDTPQPTSSPRPTNPPQPTSPPQPTNTPAPKWTYTARLVGPDVPPQSCNDGLKQIRVTVLDAAGGQLPGLWVFEQYTGQYRQTGHKGDDPYWGPGEAEYTGLDGGQVCIATSEGGPCESDFTRNLPCHDKPDFEDLWAAGFCQCCEADATKERCRELVEGGKCLGVGHYAWVVEFRRSH
jgi:hypothetical protein